MQHTKKESIISRKAKTFVTRDGQASRDFPRDTYSGRLFIHGLTANVGGISMRQPRQMPYQARHEK